MKKITANSLRDITFADSVGRNKQGNFVFREGYFYRHGRTAEGFASAVAAKLKAEGIDAELVDSGDHWASFRGGASLRTSSHFWAEFKVNTTN